MITIIVSAHKDRGWLDKAIEFAKGQTFKDIEIILSSDGNEELRSYADKHSILFNCATKGNHSTALNSAVAIAKGEWIKEVHDDDILLPNCIEDLYNARGDADFVYANAINFKGNMEIIDKYKSPSNIKLLNLMPVISCPLHAATWMVKTEVFLKVGGFDPNVFCSEEYEFYINLLTKGYKFQHCDSFVAWYRKHGDTETARYSKEKRHQIASYIINKYRKILAEV